MPLFIPYLIYQDDQGKQEGDAVGKIDGKIVRKYSIKQPQQGTEGEQGIHRQGYALGVFCADGLYRLGEEGEGCTGRGQQTDEGNEGHLGNFR